MLFEERIGEIKERSEELKQEGMEKERKLGEIEETLLINNREKFLFANKYEEIRELYDKLRLENEKNRNEMEEHMSQNDQLKEEIEELKKKEYAKGEMEDAY